MKFSSKVEKCGLSPMRKFHPYAVAAKARGVNIYHLNIGNKQIYIVIFLCFHILKRSFYYKDKKSELKGSQKKTFF